MKNLKGQMSLINLCYDLLFGYEAKRKRLLNKAPSGPIKEFLSTPFPSPDTPINMTPIVSVDFETTGLNPQKDQILSVGYINIEDNEIILSSGYHQVINVHGDLTENNVVVHQITDDLKSQGVSLELVLEKLLRNLAGKIMLVHFSRIELSFLNDACQQIYGLSPVLPIFDTLAIAKARHDNFNIPYTKNDLRLFTLRDKMNLPRYKAHNALSDALATAELFLAQVEQKNLKKSPPLKSLLS